MTRLGPSHERGPRTQPHKIVSEFSVHIYYTQHSTNVTMCSIKKRTNQCYNVFNQEEDKSMLQCVQLRREQIYG